MKGYKQSYHVSEIGNKETNSDPVITNENIAMTV